MKKCNKCLYEKPKSDFYKHKKSKDGLNGACKDCVKKAVRSRSKIVGSKYDFTEHGVIRVIYKTQKRHQKIRGHGDMPYSKDQLSSWMYRNGYKEMYDRWVSEGHDTNLKPSVDRINSNLGYSFENIRLVTWKENRLNQANDIKNGVGSGGRRTKKLLKLCKDKKIVCEYVSYQGARRDMGYSIEYQIKNGVKCRNGFYWKYK